MYRFYFADTMRPFDYWDFKNTITSKAGPYKNQLEAYQDAEQHGYLHPNLILLNDYQFALLNKITHGLV